MLDARGTANKLIEAWNNRDWDFIRESLHPETTLVTPDGQEIRGVEACLAEGWQDHAVGFPMADLRSRVPTTMATWRLPNWSCAGRTVALGSESHQPRRKSRWVGATS